MVENTSSASLGNRYPPSLSPTPRSDPPLVVVVDDQITGRTILERVIRGIDTPLEVVSFADGAAATDFIRARKPNLIVTDYLMPRMDGVSFIGHVRKLPGCADVPIIVVTVVEDKRILYEALDAGATDFLHRPIDQHECQARCRNLLALGHRSEQLIRLTAHLTIAEQRERRRLATLLHDELQQVLVGAAFGMERVERRLGDQPAMVAAKTGLKEARALVQRAIEVGHRLIADLSPPILHEAGLPEALEWLARDLRERSGLTVTLSLDRSVSPRSEDVRSIVFEAARAALDIVGNHSRGEDAALMLSRVDDDRLEVVIETRGADFGGAQWLDVVGAESGFRLMSMRERLEYLGGSLSVETVSGDGFRVIFDAPLGLLADVDERHAKSGPGDEAAVLAGSVAGASAAMGIRVLVVDDHQMIRQGLSAMLLDEPDLELVGEACDGIEAIEQVGRLMPDVVLMDFSMPNMNGLEATRRITRRWPHVRVVGLSMYDELDRAQAMLDAGASAYLNKTVDADALLEAIRRIGAQAPPA